MATTIHKGPFRQLEHYRNKLYTATTIYGESDLLILQPACKLQDLDIQSVVEETLRSNLEGVSYNTWDCETRCGTLSELIKRKLEGTNTRLSNVVVMVFIGKLNDTGLEKASHRVWKPDYDSFASAWYKNSSLFAVGTVFATYEKLGGKLAD